MKLAKKIFIIILLLIIYSYVFVITQIPENIVLLEGEKINLNPILGISLNIENNQTVSASSNIGQKVSNNTNTAKLSVNLFNSIPIKQSKVDIIPKTKVVPVRKYCRSKVICKWCFSCWNGRSKRNKTI